MTQRVSALIVGAGISGLVCAHALRKAGVDAVLVEASGRPGGSIHSEQRDGYLLEFGPQSFSATRPLLALCSELGIESELLKAPSRAPRYVLVGGELKAVPLTPPAFLTSSLLSVKTKLAIARDVFGDSQAPQQDESIAAFVRRKFSPELLDRLVGPFVSGVYAGDPERLSLRSSFPALYEAEKCKGSVIRGLMSKSGNEPRQKPTLLNFRHGMETLPRALAARLGDALQSMPPVVRVDLDSTRTSFQVTIQSHGQQERILAQNLIVATPVDVTGKILTGLHPSFNTLLSGVESAPIAVVSLGYQRPHVAHPLNGFGFLVSRSAGMRILGTVWNSSLFPGRAPNGHVLFTSFLGGATDPQAVTLSPEALASLVHSELAPLLAIRQPPAFSNVTIYPRALPQYNLGHAERLAAIESQRAQFPNLWLVGNYLRGPAIAACVEQSLDVANQILSRTKPLTQ